MKELSVRITPGPGGGPDNVVATVNCKMTVTASGQQATVYLNSALIRGSHIEAEVDFENVGAPVPSALQARVIAAVAGRVAAA